MSELPMEEVEPLIFRMTELAEDDLADALRFLSASPGGIKSAIEFNEQFDTTIRYLRQSVAEEIKERGRPRTRTNEIASTYFARPVYRYDMQIRKRARRSSTGLWYIYYSLLDTQKAGALDTLRVVAIHHSASKPFRIPTGYLLDEAEEQDRSVKEE